MTLCSPWVTAEDIDLCEPCVPEGSSGVGNLPLLERAALVSSWLLYRATGQDYPGLCTDAIRPCQGYSSAGQQLANPTGDGARAIGWPGACGCAGDYLTCGCTGHDAILVPGRPIADVVSITIDGQALDVTPGTGDVRIVDDRWLIRSDGAAWPCCQNLAAPTTDPGTSLFVYRYGVLPDPDGIAAAEVLACEFLKAWESDGECEDCRLPLRLTTVTREGMTAAAIDPFDFLEHGRFGIFEVDSFIAMVMGDRKPGERPAKVLDHRAMFPGHTRVR